MHQAKLWATQVFKLAKIYSRYLHSIPQSCAATHSHPETPFGHQTAHTDHHSASEKQPAIADHSSVEYEIY